MKSLIITLAIVFANQICIGQLKISGKITEKGTQSNLENVSVYINDLKIGATTNKNGEYQLSKIRKGIHLIEVSIEGFNSVVEKIEIDKDTILNFSLNTSAAELNEVVVTAVTRATELKRSPVIIKSIDKIALNQNSATNLIDGLKNIAGINQINTGVAISKPIIRGLGYNRVITLFNGIRQEGQQWGDEHGVEIDEYGVEKIEIVKGPGSLMYGSDGIAGVVNFISPKAPKEGEQKTQIISNYQSNNNLAGFSLSNAGNKNGFEWLGRFTHKLAGNYKNSLDGKVFNSGFKEINGGLSLGINKKWGHSHLQLNTYNSTLNLVEGERDNEGKFTFIEKDGNIKTATKSDLKGYSINFPYQKVNHVRASLNNYFIFDRATLNVDLGFQNNKRREFGDVANPNDIALYFDLNTFNYSARYNFAEKNGWETSIGSSGMQQSNTNKGLEFLIPAYKLLDAGLFAFTQKTVANKLIMAGGLRFDNRNINSEKLILDDSDMPTNTDNNTNQVKFKAFNRNYGGVSGSIGMSYLANKTNTIKVNLSQGFRAPNISELASNGRHEGTFRYEIGSLDLKSEISRQIDMAWFNNSEHLNIEFTPFVNFISNYIFAEKLADENGNEIIYEPEDPAPGYQFKQGNATLWGGELYVDFHPHPLDWLHIENSFSFVRAIQANQSDSTKNLPFIPAPKYRGELKAAFKKIGTNFSNCYVKLALDYYLMQDKFYAANGTETATPQYALLSAGLGGNVTMFKKKDFINLYLSAENLTDKAYQSHLSRLKYGPENADTGNIGVFNMGRNISLKMIVNF
jgi:iron complex outermembrane recepter protein